jgi:hypothetical protein
MVAQSGSNFQLGLPMNQLDPFAKSGLVFL